MNGGALEFSDNSIRNFWTKFFQLGGGQYLNYFNIHYNNERSPDAKQNPATFQEVLTFFNNLMEKNGDKKPLYLTEFGIYSGSPSSQPIGEPAQETGQVQTNLPTQQMPPEQSSNQPSGGKCGDGICDDFEKQNPNTCPKDCQTGIQQPTQQPQLEKSIPNQNLPYQSQESQAALYFKYSILAFANGVNVIFIDLVGSDNDIIGSSMAFNIDGQPRLFLVALKTINQKLAGFSEVEKIADGQYKFTVGGKNVYAFWSGNLPVEIKGQVKVIDINGEENLLNVQEIKFSSQSPVLVEI